MRLSRRSRVGSARARKRRSMAKGLFVFGIAGVIIYGLTDMSKARKVIHMLKRICLNAWKAGAGSTWSPPERRRNGSENNESIESPHRNSRRRRHKEHRVLPEALWDRAL